jgi:hypothetical protein
MKHPVRDDFDTAVTEAGVAVTFKPTNSIDGDTFHALALPRWQVSAEIPRITLPVKCRGWPNVSPQRSPPRFGGYRARKRLIV